MCDRTAAPNRPSADGERVRFDTVTGGRGVKVGRLDLFVIERRPCDINDLEQAHSVSCYVPSPAAPDATALYNEACPTVPCRETR
jgi:hypothetical protein